MKGASAIKTDIIKKLDELAVKELNTNFSIMKMSVNTQIALILMLKDVLSKDEFNDLMTFSTEEINKHKHKVR